MNAQTRLEAETLASAMAQAFGEIEAATKSANNPHFKSKYADLGAVIEAIKPALIKHGLFFTQHPKPSDKGVTVETVLHHANGEHFSMGELFVPANKQDAQGFGSALTYARRYALVTAFGVPVEDDDGNAAAKSSGRDNAGESTVSPPGATSNGPISTPQGMPDHEFARIVQLIEATKTDRTKMLAHFKVRDIRQLNQAQFNEAVEKLTADLAAMAKSETNQAATNFGEVLADEIPY